jgi:hypothetical protein
MSSFNQIGFSAGFDGGVNTPGAVAGAFNSVAFSGGFYGGIDTSFGALEAFDSVGFSGGFYGGVDTGTGTMPQGSLYSGRAQGNTYRPNRIARTTR